jgi:hypothetical protein
LVDDRLGLGDAGAGLVELALHLIDRLLGAVLLGGQLLACA